MDGNIFFNFYSIAEYSGYTFNGTNVSIFFNFSFHGCRIAPRLQKFWIWGAGACCLMLFWGVIALGYDTLSLL